MSGIEVSGPVVRISVEERVATFHHRCTDWSFENFGITEARLPLGDGGRQLVNENTISPSILCHNCGAHGFWADGEWKDC